MKAFKAVIDSVWAEAAMLVAVLANTLLLIALTGPGWGKPRDASPTLATLGLWKACAPADDNGKTYCNGLGQYNLPGWFTSIQALITTSTAGLLCAFGVMFVFACIGRVKQDRRLLVVYIITTLIFAVIGLAGVVLFGHRVGEIIIKGVPPLTTAWSWILAATGVGVHFLCITLVIIELIVGPRRLTTSSDTDPVVADAADMGTTGPPVAMETVA